MDTLPHDFLLLALDDETGISLCKDRYVLNASISAAFVGHLQFSDRLVAVAANQFALASGPLSDGVIGQAEEALVGKKPGTVKQCMGWLRGFWGNRDLEGWLKEDLVRRMVLRQEQDHFLFIPYRTRHPAGDMGPELELKQRLRRHVAAVTLDDPPCRDDALLSLLRAAKLLDVVFSEAEQARYHEVLLERTRRAPLGKDAKAVGDQHRTAAQVAMTAAIS